MPPLASAHGGAALLLKSKLSESSLASPSQLLSPNGTLSFAVLCNLAGVRKTGLIPPGQTSGARSPL